MRGASKLRRAAVFALVLMLVTSMVAPSAMAAPDDESSTENCSGQFALSILQGPIFGTSPDDSCWSRVSTNATATDIYQGTLRDKDSQESFLTTYSNFATSSLSYLRANAKAKAVEGLRNGSTLANVSTTVNKSVEDQVSQLQLNVIKAHNSTVRSTQYGVISQENDSVEVYLMEASEGNETSNLEATILENDGLRKVYTRDSALEEGVSNQRALALNTTNVTLANGTVVQAQIFDAWYLGNDGTTKDDDYISHKVSPYDQFENFNTVGVVDGFGNQYLQIHSSNKEGTGGTILDGPDKSVVNTTDVYSSYKWRQQWTSLEDISPSITANSHTYIKGLNSTYSTSELQNITVLDGITLAQEYNTNRNTTGFNGWAAAELSLLGIDHNGTNAFTVEYTPRNASGVLLPNQTRTLRGSLLTDYQPAKTNGSFVVGTTYDTANSSSPVFFANQTNATESAVLKLDGEFTITQLTNTQTGASLNETTVQGNDITQSWNVSLTEDEFQKLLNQRDNYSTYYDGAGGGGGGGGFNFDFGAAGLGFIVIAGGGLLLLSNRAS